MVPENMLPAPVVYMLSDKLTMLTVYSIVYVVAKHEPDIGVALGILVGFLQIRFLL